MKLPRTAPDGLILLLSLAKSPSGAFLCFLFFVLEAVENRAGGG